MFLHAALRNSPNYSQMTQQQQTTNPMHLLFSPGAAALRNSTNMMANSPLSSMSNGINGMTLHQQQYQQQTPIKTSKRDKSEKSAEKRSAAEKNHIKKPCNAFMWFMKENRGLILKEEGGQQKQSALLNQKLGKIWQEMSKSQQQKYYDMAAAERDEHMKKYPEWTARDNYAIHKKKKKKREKSMGKFNFSNIKNTFILFCGLAKTIYIK